MTTVAIVTSTVFGGDPKSCFEAGLAASGAAKPNIPSPYEAQGNYSLLPTLVSNAASTHPDLIVTAGGQVAAMAAANMLNQAKGDPQFIYLSGILLTGSNQCNSGGVNMNVPIENSVRKSLLTGNPYNVDPARIWLVVNNNAPMSSPEIAAWGANHQSFFTTGPNPPTNSNDASSNNSFIHEFSVLASKQPAPLGLVISPDPYFRHWRRAFTIALDDQLPVPVCYPYRDFVIAAQPTGNAGNSISLDRPFLSRAAGDGAQQISKTAYYQLGYQAGQYLIAKASGHPKQFVGVITWNGTDWA